MLVQEVAKKYGMALFQAAQKRNLLDSGHAQMVSVRAMLRQDATLVNFLTAPQVPDDKKLELVKRVFEPRVDKLFVQFFVVLVEKARAGFLPEILDEFDRLVKEAKGIIQVTVITAVALSPKEQQALTSQLEKKTKSKIELLLRVDAAILGGMIIMMRGEIIDGSVRHGLQQLEEQLEKVKVA